MKRYLTNQCKSFQGFHMWHIVLISLKRVLAISNYNVMASNNEWYHFYVSLHCQTCLRMTPQYLNASLSPNHTKSNKFQHV